MAFFIVDRQAARQAIETGQNLPVGGGFARLSFAYDTFHPRERLFAGGDDRGGVYESDYLSRRDDREVSNSIAATALEQAQWALANGYRRSGARAGDDADGDGFQQVNTFFLPVALVASGWARPRPFAVGAGKGIA
jgi:hypothetical protein